MTWTSPIDPPADGNAITRAFFITYVKDNLAHLRVVTGGDPVGAHVALISSGSGVGAWTTIPNDAMEHPKVSIEGDVMDGALEIEVNTSATADASFPALAGLTVRTDNGSYPAIQFDKSGDNNMALYFDGDFLQWVNAGAVNYRVVGSPDDEEIKVDSPGRIWLTADGSAAAPLVSVGSAGDTGFYHGGAHEIGFSTSATGRGRVTDTGIFLWGASPPSQSVAGQTIRVDGRLLATAYDVVSARAGKRNIEPLHVSRESFDRIRPQRYVRVVHEWEDEATWHARNDGQERPVIERVSDQVEFGLIADDVRDVLPELAPNGQSLDVYGALAVCIDMLQQAHARIDALEPV